MLRHAVSRASITPYPDTYTSSNRVSDELERTTPHQQRWPAVYIAAIPGPTDTVPRAAGDMYMRGPRAERRSVPRVQPPIGDHGQSGAQFLVANRRVPEGLRLQLNLRG